MFHNAVNVDCFREGKIRHPLQRIVDRNFILRSSSYWFLRLLHATSCVVICLCRMTTPSASALTAIMDCAEMTMSGRPLAGKIVAKTENIFGMAKWIKAPLLLFWLRQPEQICFRIESEWVTSSFESCEAGTSHQFTKFVDGAERRHAVRLCLSGRETRRLRWLGRFLWPRISSLLIKNGKTCKAKHTIWDSRRLRRGRMCFGWTRKVFFDLGA